MRRVDERSARASLLGLVCFAVISTIGVVIVVNLQWVSVMIYYRVEPAEWGLVLRGLAIILWLVGCQLLTRPAAARQSLLQMSVGAAVALGGMMYGGVVWPTSDLATTSEVIGSFAVASVALAVMWRVNRGCGLVQRSRRNLLLGVALLVLALTLPTFLLSYFAHDITENTWHPVSMLM